LTRRRPSTSSVSDTPAAVDESDTGGRCTGAAKAAITRLPLDI
jgi:hypothetical protein